MSDKDFTGVPTSMYIIKGNFTDEMGSLRDVRIDDDIVTPESFIGKGLSHYSVHHLLRWNDSPDFAGWNFIKEHYLASFRSYEDAQMFATAKRVGKL